MMRPFEYVHASSLAAALKQLGPDWTVRIKAGGIDLVDEMKERLITPKRVVSLLKVPGLDGIKSAAKGLSLGPLVTLHRLATDKALAGPYRCLAEAAAHAATPQLRQVATLGGNLCQRPRCWYYRSEETRCLKKGGSICFAQQGDNRFHAIFGNRTCAIVHPSATAVALTALDARVKVASAKGERELAIGDFFALPDTDPKRENVLEPNEILAEVRVPKPGAGVRSAYLKQKEKQSFDWATAEVAVVLDLQGGTCQRARIVLGAAAPVPWRAKAAEKALVGKKVDATTAGAAARLALQGARPLAHNAYKLPLFEVLTRRALLAAVEGGRP